MKNSFYVLESNVMANHVKMNENLNEINRKYKNMDKGSMCGGCQTIVEIHDNGRAPAANASTNDNCTDNSIGSPTADADTERHTDPSYHNPEYEHDDDETTDDQKQLNEPVRTFRLHNASHTSGWDTLWRVCIMIVYLGIVGELMGLMGGNVLMVSADITTPSQNTFKREIGICGSKDLKNHPSNMTALLRDCHVIEGHLVISLMDNATEEDFVGVTFPNLTEVTEFVVFYQIGGITSLGKLFPNLSVIRGNHLVLNYALVILELNNLRDVGLYSLTHIGRGGVRIEKNKQLCFLTSIDWKLIARNASDDSLVIKPSINEAVCEDCREAENHELRYYGGKNDNNMTRECPISKSTNRPLCWNLQHCQIVCPEYCGSLACNARGVCCDESCLDNCIESPTKCTICRYFSLGRYGDRQCVRQCPHNLFHHMERRCIDGSTCRRIPRPLRSLSEDPYPYIPFNRQCLLDCPVGYAMRGLLDNKTCHICEGGPCKKTCAGDKIETLQSMARFIGCTHIKGNIIIYLRSRAENMVNELDKALSHIQEIDGYLKIIRSFPLISLNFFKSLRVITGAKLEANRYALYVQYNENLMELFPNNVTILKGRVSFHFNPRLCLYKIERLAPFIIEPMNMNDTSDISDISNGEKTACNVTKMHMTIEQVFSRGALFYLKPLKFVDDRVVLSYVFSYIEAPYQNVSIYDNRDACYDAWTLTDITEITDKNEPEVPQVAVFLATHLKPYTQYAIYAKTSTIASEKRGGQTDIMYFTTTPDQPTTVRKLKITNVKSNSIFVEWLAPSSPNGKLVMYIIKVKLIPDMPAKNRDYCKSTITVDISKPPTIITPVKEKLEEDAEATAKNCRCAEKKFEAREEEAESFMNFENALQNLVYIKKRNNAFDLTYKSANKIKSKRSLDPDYSVPDARVLQKYREMLESMPHVSEVSPELFQKYVYQKELEKDFNRRVRQAIEKNDTVALNNELNGYGMKPVTGDDMSMSIPAPNIFPTKPKNTSTENPPADDTVSRKVGEYYEYIYQEVNATGNNGSVLLTGLKHFSMYQIEVIACREGEETVENKNCSDPVDIEQRTLKNESADSIEYLDYKILPTNSSSSSKVKVRFTWPVPKDPNNFIVSYRLIYIRQDIDNFQQTPLCLNFDEVEEISNGLVQTYIDLVRGNYSVEVKATSLAGESAYGAVKAFYIEPISDNLYIIFGSIGVGVIVCLIVGVWFLVRYRKESRKFKGLRIYASVNPDYVGVPYVADEWELPRESICRGTELGQGSFGMVYSGLYYSSDQQNPIPCAIKAVNSNATDGERWNFLKEASVMKSFDTPHVVRLYGVVSKGQPTLVVMELMDKGDLKSYLRSTRSLEQKDEPGQQQKLLPDQSESAERPQPPTVKQMLQMAIEIADGMAYLAAHKFVHRDLAARNCMVSGNLTVKIGDFGMTRDIYETDYYRKGTKGLLPVRWMAPESLKDGLFSTSSDVFSYGVVLWEMATLAAQPYQGLSNDQVLKYVIEGGIMEKPEHCPEYLYLLMTRCWQHGPGSRPTFLHITNALSPHATDEFKRNSYYYTGGGKEVYESQLPKSTAVNTIPAQVDAGERAIECVNEPGDDPADGGNGREGAIPLANMGQSGMRRSRSGLKGRESTTETSDTGDSEQPLTSKPISVQPLRKQAAAAVAAAASTSVAVEDERSPPSKLTREWATEFSPKAKTKAKESVPMKTIPKSRSAALKPEFQSAQAEAPKRSTSYGQAIVGPGTYRSVSERAPLLGSEGSAESAPGTPVRSSESTSNEETRSALPYSKLVPQEWEGKGQHKATVHSPDERQQLLPSTDDQESDPQDQNLFGLRQRIQVQIHQPESQSTTPAGPSGQAAKRTPPKTLAVPRERPKSKSPPEKSKTSPKRPQATKPGKSMMDLLGPSTSYREERARRQRERGAVARSSEPAPLPVPSTSGRMPFSPPSIVEQASTSSGGGLDTQSGSSSESALLPRQAAKVKSPKKHAKEFTRSARTESDVPLEPSMGVKRRQHSDTSSTDSGEAIRNIQFEAGATASDRPTTSRAADRRGWIQESIAARQSQPGTSRGLDLNLQRQGSSTSSDPDLTALRRRSYQGYVDESVPSTRYARVAQEDSSPDESPKDEEGPPPYSLVTSRPLVPVVSVTSEALTSPEEEAPREQPERFRPHFRPTTISDVGTSSESQDTVSELLESPEAAQASHSLEAASLPQPTAQSPSVSDPGLGAGTSSSSARTGEDTRLEELEYQRSPEYEEAEREREARMARMLSPVFPEEASLKALLFQDDNKDDSVEKPPLERSAEHHTDSESEGENNAQS